jgi:hypothetical protein
VGDAEDLSSEHEDFNVTIYIGALMLINRRELLMAPPRLERLTVKKKRSAGEGRDGRVVIDQSQVNDG